jgi:hypothetical protein
MDVIIMDNNSYPRINGSMKSMSLESEDFILSEELENIKSIIHGNFSGETYIKLISFLEIFIILIANHLISFATKNLLFFFITHLHLFNINHRTQN